MNIPELQLDKQHKYYKDRHQSRIGRTKKHAQKKQRERRFEHKHSKTPGTQEYWDMEDFEHEIYL